MQYNTDDELFGLVMLVISEMLSCRFPEKRSQTSPFTLPNAMRPLGEHEACFMQDMFAECC